jgi:hypothetical protein
MAVACTKTQSATMTLIGPTGAATTSLLSYDRPYSNRETQARFRCSDQEAPS